MVLRRREMNSLEKGGGKRKHEGISDDAAETSCPASPRA